MFLVVGVFILPILTSGNISFEVVGVLFGLAVLMCSMTPVVLSGCGKTLLSTQGQKLSDDKRRPIPCSGRIIRIGLSHAECRRDS